MEIGRARRDALKLYRSFGRFIDDDEYHIPAVRQCDSAFCCEKGKSKYGSNRSFELTICLGQASLSSRSRREDRSHDEIQQ